MWRMLLHGRGLGSQGSREWGQDSVSGSMVKVELSGSHFPDSRESRGAVILATKTGAVRH